ncbi:ABC transporter permease [Rhizobium sp. VS19-DR104.2]|uniref:ABC transporter permease n=1 Tax=unclassified Rhizobium TaxID=2613769 RepID=UPI001ADA4900|nr:MULTISPECIES: ABC transporter permease [unclassified Rhizobium]MBO9171094.1 ABC transporter permease [Rhizobium sp. L245/93]MBO9186996.1 ABC transporter permease [Rhizobium sp. E27B/91]MBZ5761863.1 ABC transporter permease [Rhizobium sp. VS19-DR96]MBZ5767943.1 ABC transporter permease [Rhizobium sp. VS19-DR129.2]MBZ5775291.1 ABC transporter permease [Rhizobium sp. VS19-DRK62.2]
MAASLRLQRLPSASPVIAFAARAAAIVIALVFAGIVLSLTGADPLNLGLQVLSASFGSSFGLEDLALLLIPLILTGLSVAVAQQIGAWNIGAEGQFYAGAFGAAAVGLFVPGPPVIILPMMFVAGLVGGAAWILVPTLARAYAGVNELITTLLLNFVAILLVYYVSTNAWRDKMANSATKRLSAEIPDFWGSVHWGLPIAVIVALAVAALLAFSRWGYEVRLVGSNPSAARYAGMPVRRHLITVMLLSGAIAGLAGMLEIAGTVHRLQGGISNNYGYLGIMVAVLARSSAIGVIFSAALMAFILNSGIILQTQGLTTSTVLAITGLILFLTAIGDELAHYRIARDKA